MLIFERIELINFRRYVKNTFDFNDHRNNTLNIILARNGIGKSTLFDAFTWCLFGSEDHLKIDARYKKESERIANTEALTKLQKNNKLDVSVIIFMKDLETGTKYKIKRCCEFFKGDEEDILYDNESRAKAQVLLWNERSGDWVPQDNPESTINSIIPEDLRQFFFFDGEQLRTHFESDTSRYLKDKIEQVSRTDVLKSAIEHLEHYGLYLSRKKQKTTSNKQLQADEERRQSLFEALKQKKIELGDKRGRLSQIEAELDKIKDTKNKLGAENTSINLLNLEYEKWETQKESALDMKREIENKYHEFLILKAPLIFLVKELKNATSIIHDAQKRGEVPPPITKEYLLKRIHEYKTCICGETLDGDIGKKRRMNLERMIKDTEAKVSVNFPEGLFFYDKNCMELKDFLKEIESFSDKLIGYEKQIKTAEEMKEEIDRRRKRVDSNLYEQCIKKENELVKERESLNWSVRLLTDGTDSITDIENEIDRVKTAIERGSREATIYSELNKKQSIAEDLQTEISKFKDDIIKKNTDELKTKTEEFLRDMLIEKSEEIENVEIDKNFELKIVSRINPLINLKHTLSAGETQIFVMAFAAALRDVTGHNAPLVIDTPLGKIDAEYRSLVVDSFPKILKKAQLILLVTTSEYTDSIRSKMKEIANDFIEYEVEKDGNKNTVKAVKS